MTGTKTLFFGIPRVKDEPNIPIETKIGDPMINVKSITNEFFNGISKNIDTIYNYNINIDKLERLTFLLKNKDCNNDINTNEDLADSICDY